MRIAIIGCTHAGTMAAKQILTEAPGTEVAIYERNDNISFLSCGISLYLDGTVKQLEDMFYSSPSELRGLGATINMRHNVLAVDAVKNQLRVMDLETSEIREETYDKLIMATGSRAVAPPISGAMSERVLLCKNYAQAQEIYARAQDNHRIAIVGAGYVGVEMAESYSWTGHDVELIQSSDQVLGHYLDHRMSDEVVKVLQDQGVKVTLGQPVTSFTETADGVTIHTAGGDTVADLVLVTTGFQPVTELLADQIERTKNGAIVVNEYCQTSNPDIYAAGDCAVSFFNPTGKNVYAPLATNAIRQGVIAGTNVLGNSMPYMGTQATTAMRLFDYTLASTGLTLEYAQKHGINAHQVVYQGFWRPEYMPTTDAITITLVYNADTRAILGAQLISKHEVAQSANTISLAIQNGNTIDDLAMVDMLFQPHYDYPFNYLNQAAQLAVATEQRAGGQPRFTALGSRRPSGRD